MSRLLRKTKKKILLKKHKNKRFWKYQVDLKSRHQKWLRTHKNRKGRSLKEEDPLRKLRMKTNQWEGLAR